MPNGAPLTCNDMGVIGNGVFALRELRWPGVVHGSRLFQQ